jgi:hypothetical protein
VRVALRIAATIASTAVASATVASTTVARATVASTTVARASASASEASTARATAACSVAGSAGSAGVASVGWSPRIAIDRAAAVAELGTGRAGNVWNAAVVDAARAVRAGGLAAAVDAGR